MRAVVVGGSLAGQCAALALSRDGWLVTVLERSSAEPSAGTGIGIDRRLLSSVIGADTRALRVIHGGFEQTAWGLVRALLVDELQLRPGVGIHSGRQVVDVWNDETRDEAVVLTTEGEVRADLVVGADGFGSTVRRFVAPEHPHATYSGYLLWRGLIEEQHIPGGFAPRNLDFAEHLAPGARLVTFGVPGRDGETRPGHRRGSFSWFDTSRTELLERSGHLDGDVVTGTIAGDEISDDLVAELRSFARRQWPSPWRQAIDGSLLRREFIGTPIAEYLPHRLARDAVALIGDAAHVVSPVTGAGFHNALLDIEALSAALRHTPRDGVHEALSRYQRRRLQSARLLVRQSQQWSRTYVPSQLNPFLEAIEQ